MGRQAYAEGYAARDWAIFPCQVNGKAPATRSGCYAATTDMVTVRQRWRTTDWNIGITAGPSGLVFIDMDIDPEHGPPGVSSFLELCAAADFDMESTYCVTTPGGGAHAYFTVEDGFWYPASVKRVAPNIDIRASWTYVVAAGSVIDGAAYEHFGADQPVELPRWLGIIIDRPPPDIARIERKHTLDVRASDDARMKAWRGIADHFRYQATAGTDRNSYYYWAVRAVGDHLWPAEFKDACVLELKDIGRELGLDANEIKASAESAMRRWP